MRECSGVGVPVSGTYIVITKYSLRSDHHDMISVYRNASNRPIWNLDFTVFALRILGFLFQSHCCSSPAGSFQWNTTIVGGIDHGICPHGSLIPPPEVVDFMKLSIGILTSLMEYRGRWSNTTLNGTENWDFSEWNITDGRLSNDTFEAIKEELISRAIELIRNVTFVSRSDGDRDREHENETSSMNQPNAGSASVHQPVDGEDGDIDHVTTNFWWVDIAKAVDMMDQQKFLKDSNLGVTGILDIIQMIDSLPGYMHKPMLPAILIETGKILVDLRGMDPMATAVDDLLKLERGEQHGQSKLKRKKRDVDEVESDLILEGGKEDTDWVNEEELLFNLTAVMEALEEAAK